MAAQRAAGFTIEGRGSRKHALARPAGLLFPLCWAMMAFSTRRQGDPFSYAGTVVGTLCAMAQTNPANSRATATIATGPSLLRCVRRQ